MPVHRQTLIRKLKLKMIEKRISTPAVFALLFSGMGFMLLLVLVIFERSAFDLLFDVRNRSDEAVRNVFGALRMVIDVLPYTLGPFIIGTFLFGLIQVTRTRLKLLPLFILICYTLPIIWNITFADTVGVVEILKNTSNQHSLEQIRLATQGVMRQHHIGIIGFGIFLIGQTLFIIQIINRKTVSDLEKASR